MAEQTIWLHHLGGQVEYVSGNRFNTRCLKSGRGEETPLIFLHGIGGHVEAFCKNVRPLGKELNRPVYALDFIGHGFSDTPDDVDYSVSDYMDQVEDFIHTIGYKEAHIFGESLGGLVATRIGLDRPALAATLGLITPAGLQNLNLPDEIDEKIKKESDEGTKDLYTRTMEMLEAGVTRETVYHRMDWLFVDDPDEELVDIRHQIYRREPVQRVMPKIYKQDREYFTIEELETLDIPVLMLHTEHNPSSKKEQAEYAHGFLPDSEYHVFDHSGHWPQYEEPEQFNEIVAQFIQRREGA